MTTARRVALGLAAVVAVAAGCGGGGGGGGGSSTSVQPPAGSASVVDASVPIEDACTDAISELGSVTVPTSADWTARGRAALALARAGARLAAGAAALGVAGRDLLDPAKAIAAGGAAAVDAVARRDRAAYRQADDAAWDGEMRFVAVADRAGLDRCSSIRATASASLIGSEDAAPEAIAAGRSLDYATWWCRLRRGSLPASDRGFIVSQIVTTVQELERTPMRPSGLSLNPGAELSYGDLVDRLRLTIEHCPRLAISTADGAALAHVKAVLPPGGSEVAN